MNNTLRVPLSSTQVAVYTVWILPVILTSFLLNTSQLDFYSILLWAVSPSSMHSMIS